MLRDSYWGWVHADDGDRGVRADECMYVFDWGGLRVRRELMILQFSSGRRSSASDGGMAATIAEYKM